jgi:outer membrane murein-binding lipoprotein Lpp
VSRLDELLVRVRSHGLPYEADRRDLHLYRAVCPACRVADYTLLIRERRDGIRLACAAGCSEREVLAALNADPLQSRVVELEAQVEQLLSMVEAARDLAGRAIDMARASQDNTPALRVAA